MEDNSVNKKDTGLRLSRHFVFAEGGKTLELWLEEDGFFRLKYEEKEDGGFATNEESGHYFSDSPNSLVLAAAERSWKWKDSHDGDSGIDATDLKYPCTLKNDNKEITVNYLEVDYLAKIVQ